MFFENPCGRIQFSAARIEIAEIHTPPVFDEEKRSRTHVKCFSFGRPEIWQPRVVGLLRRLIGALFPSFRGYFRI